MSFSWLAGGLAGCWAVLLVVGWWAELSAVGEHAMQVPVVCNGYETAAGCCGAGLKRVVHVAALLLLLFTYSCLLFVCRLFHPCRRT